MSEIIAFDPKVWDMPIMCESYMYSGIHFIVHNRMNFMIKKSVEGYNLLILVPSLSIDIHVSC